jgi:uncharacterized protein (DUF2147 family)
MENAMKTLSTFLFLVLALSWSTPGHCANKADDLLGQWYTEDDDSKVVVTKENGKYFGKIIWLKEPVYGKDEDDTGKPKRDKLNSTRKLRKRPILGLPVLKGFKFNAKENTWEGGTIYDPEKGKTYKCVIKFEKDAKVHKGKKLYVRGYIGIPTLGRTTYWHYVPEKDLEKLEK